MNILDIINEFKKDCPCGRKHETAIKDVRIASGIVGEVGSILSENGFSHKLLLVADKNPLKASEGIEESLKDFEIEYKIYDDIRKLLSDQQYAKMNGFTPSHFSFNMDGGRCPDAENQAWFFAAEDDECPCGRGGG